MVQALAVKTSLDSVGDSVKFDRMLSGESDEDEGLSPRGSSWCSSVGPS